MAHCIHYQAEYKTVLYKRLCGGGLQVAGPFQTNYFLYMALNASLYEADFSDFFSETNKVPTKEGGGINLQVKSWNILAKKWTAFINSWQEKVIAICLICVFLFNGSKNTVIIFEFFTFWNTTQNCALKIRILGAWMDFDWWREREKERAAIFLSSSCSHLNGNF